MNHTNKQEQLALLLTYKLLQDLADPKKLAVASEHVRDQARTILRHYPVPAKLDLLYRELKKGTPNEL